MLKLLPTLIVTLAASPALAGATAWQDIAPGVRARLISADTVTAGTTRAGLELDLPAGTHTYWRIPGEAGIPAQFDFSGSTGLGAPVIDWPYPEIDHTGGYLGYIYSGPLVIPLHFGVTGGDARLSARVTLGVCSEICVPAQASFTLPISYTTADPGQGIRLDQAEARTPIAWDRPKPAFGAVTATPDGISLAAPDPAIDPQSLIADVGDPAILFQTPQKSPDGTVWTLKLLGGAGGKGLEGRTIQLTFMTPAGPYVVTRQIGASAS
jgi:DsbC/DsbD-like thiol-disulfide interchange protein